MHLRDATISDIPHLAALFLAGSLDDPDYDIVYPWRTTAPDDFAQLMSAEIMQKFLQGKGRFLVIETAQLQVVGCACWTRKGGSSAAVAIRAENDSALKALERTLCRLQETLHYPLVRVFGLAPRLRDEGPLMKRFNEVFDRFCEQLWVGDLAEHWFLQKLCVHVDWRRQGIATILLQWGQDRAREEGIVVCLNSSRAGLAMYGKAGFVQIASLTIELPDVTVPLMVWRPEKAS